MTAECNVRSMCHTSSSHLTRTYREAATSRLTRSQSGTMMVLSLELMLRSVKTILPHVAEKKEESVFNDKEVNGPANA